MEVKFSTFDIKESAKRIDDILNSSDGAYSQRQGIPSRSSLTFTNGFYVDVTVVFIDMRDSKNIATKHTRPVLAKIFRSYISEVVAVLKGNALINEVYIEGDGIWAIFDTRTKVDVQSVFNTAAQVSSLVELLNSKYRKRGYSEIRVGIGMDDGESLYVKAGYKGAAVNEVVWLGKVVGRAAALCSQGNKLDSDGQIMVSEQVHQMLSSYQRGFLSWNFMRQCYHGNVVNAMMSGWVAVHG